MGEDLDDRETNRTGRLSFDPAALLCAAQDPARYLGFLDRDDDPAAGQAATPVEATTIRERPFDLGTVAARLAAALTGDHASDHRPNEPAKDVPTQSVPTQSVPGVPHHRLRHPVLRAPTSAMRTPTKEPIGEQAAHYRAHSADLTLTGGPETALAAGASVCALAEQYVLRRIGGSSAAAVTAAACAASEFGRTSLPPSGPGTPETVQPGFAGLAGMLAWLAGIGPNNPNGPAGPNDPADPRGPGWRLTRMLQPDPESRTLFRLVVATLRPRQPGSARRTTRVLSAALATLDRTAWAVVALLWLGAIAGSVGVLTVIARSTRVSPFLVPVAAAAITITFVLAAIFGSLLLTGQAVAAGIRAGVTLDGFGLVPGVHTTNVERRLDRVAGLLPAAGTPALFDWIADRLDDLAGIPTPAGDTARYALTFGELWLGRVGGRAGADLQSLCRAATDPKRRVTDLTLVATDASAGRPWLLPFRVTERREQSTGSAFFFCRNCLVELLPVRVVNQMVLMAPDVPTSAVCPRHRDEPLHQLPEPWDLPIVFAVRLAAATPGMLRAVPLYAPAAAGQEPRPHWFGDGAVTGGLPAKAFDTPLPGWPTFSLSTISHDESSQGTAEEDPYVDGVLVPALDTASPPGRWRPVRGPGEFAAALAGAAANWRDVVRAQSPGRRAGLAVVQGISGRGPFLDDEEIRTLVVRGYGAGQQLRARFETADDVGNFTGTDRFRWIRMRSALTECRQLSLSIGLSLPLYTDLALAYRVPDGLGGWFTPPLPPGQADPAWGDAVAAVTHLRSLTEGGVLDWDTDWGAPPPEPFERLS